MEFSQFLGSLHPPLVHLPIVILLCALAFDLSGLLFRNATAHRIGKLLVIPGVIALLFAFICGICAEIWAGRAGVPHQQIKWHELAATLCSWIFLGLGIWRVYLHSNNRRGITAYIICGGMAVLLILLTAHIGGELVYEYGAAVRGARAHTALSVHDLNTLAQRQTDLNLRYSDWMHHIFGVIVLALSVTIALNVWFPTKAHRLRWVGPLLLLLSGIFLFFFADLDLYKLTDPRQFYDREAQAHKLIALLLFIFGGRGLWLSRRKNQDAAKPAHMIQRQNQLIAVLSLIGGGLLFTHVHTVAPYANVAAGVYANHIALGIVALIIGALKLAENALPNKKRLCECLFPVLVAFEALLLITYTEGLPWWMGYGHYNRWGAHGGNIAPYGDVRAELTFDPVTAQMNVYVMERMTDKPVAVDAHEMQVIVAQGYRRAEVPVVPVDGEITAGKTAHFQGTAVFLKDAPLFDAWLDLPLGGKLKRGYFDPWVISAISGIPPNEKVNFICPMHEGVQTFKPATCPICGMDLVPYQPLAKYEMHQDRYAMRLEPVTAGEIASGHPVKLRFTPTLKENGEILKNLFVMHEHPMHLAVVSEDLTYFDHVHPILQKDGTFTLDYTFPHGGTFLLYSDIAPRGERPQSFRLPLTIAGAIPTPEKLKPRAAEGRQFGDYYVEMYVQPREIVAQRDVQLSFRVYQHDKPVTDLEPYLGSMGHCAIISADTQIFLHSHPLEFRQILKTDRDGPEVSFETHFPEPGLYKIWGQFKHNGKIVVADFVVNVEASLFPKAVVGFLLFD